MNKKIGRPKLNVKKKIEEKTFNLEKVKILAMHGFTDVELAEMLNVSGRTITTWKKDQDFDSALKKGKLEADAKVVRSLYERATGYEHEDTYFTQSKGEILSTTYIKHYPPDPVSMIFWLKNRRPDKWRDRQELELTKPLEIIIADYRGKNADKS